MKKRMAFAAAALAAAGISGTLQAYVTYGKWGSAQVQLYINPANRDVTADAAEAAVMSAADAWGTQSRANFRYVYGGRVNDTARAYDGRNVVMFRTESGGGALATTYWWTSNGKITDADVVVWDADYVFYTGTSGCSGGAYVEDVIVHELGHALGLRHSDVADASMYPSYNYCSQEMRTLAADDIAAVEALYPPSGAATNSAPAVNISTPADASSFLQGASVTFTGSASDQQDGSLTSQLVWGSNISGTLGTGGAASAILPVGAHVITASVTDKGGLTTSRQISVTIRSASDSTAAPTTISLAARGYKVRGLQRVDLTWQGITTTNVDLYRNGTLAKSLANDGTETDLLSTKGGGSYTYKACEAATNNCSPPVQVVF